MTCPDIIVSPWVDYFLVWPGKDLDELGATNVTQEPRTIVLEQQLRSEVLFLVRRISEVHCREFQECHRAAKSFILRNMCRRSRILLPPLRHSIKLDFLGPATAVPIFLKEIPHETPTTLNDPIRGIGPAGRSAGFRRSIASRRANRNGDSHFSEQWQERRRRTQLRPGFGQPGLTVWRNRGRRPVWPGNSLQANRGRECLEGD